MFRITAGETWIDGVPVVQNDGSLHKPLALFLLTYIIIVNWVLLQVSVAVLLDNFINTTGNIEQEEEFRKSNETRKLEQLENPLEPLLDQISNKFLSDNDLNDTLLLLFKV